MSLVDDPTAFSAAMADTPVVAIVRLPSADAAIPVAMAVHAGGVQLIEVTLTTEGALDSVGAMRKSGLDGLSIGVGSVRTVDDAKRSIDAGAQYLITPTTNVDVIAAAQEANVPIACGGLTPTELDTAHQAGADYVKLFPASAVGPRYLREVLAPLPGLRVIPTGGINAANIPDFRDAGAVGVGIGSALVDKATVANGDWAELEHRATAMVAAWRS